VVEPSAGIDILGEGIPSAVQLKSQKYSLRKEIESIKVISGQTVVKFKDIHSIDAAFRLIGYSLYGEMDGTPEIGDRPAQLIGFEVRDDQGEIWGTVTAFLDQPMNPLLEISRGLGAEPILVPFRPAIIHEIRTEDKTVVIHPPAGLKDLNR